MREAGPLTVLSVGYSLAPVGPDSVGGSEQVLAALNSALVAAGHRSIVVGCRGSSVQGELVETPYSPVGQPITDPVRARAQQDTREAIAAALDRWPVDLIHMHGFDFASCLPPPGPPVIVTLHLPPGWYPPGSLEPSRPATWLHCVSLAQQHECPAGTQLLPPIANGVAVHAFAARSTRRGFALMLARICPEKGQHFALEAAHAAGVTLLIAGEVFPYPAHTDYFASKVRPLLDRGRKFLGAVGFARKRRLLAAARCVLIPSLAPETSSLTAMEAAASGTPVIAFPSGALAEIVEHGRTGFLVNGVGEMAASIVRAEEIEAEECRRVARTRFSLERMTAQYLALYQRLAAGSV